MIKRAVEKFLACGDLHGGFARVRCPCCDHEFFVAFSCRRRCLCPSCHQKRALVIAGHIARDVCAPVAHRQFVFTIPKRLRPEDKPAAVPV
ncbi:MAG: transposase zinc-binding domain-containing protein [Planctomycetota bacterium]